MATELERLLIRLEADTERLKRHLMEGEKTVEKSTDKMSKSMDDFSKRAVSAAKKIAAPLLAAFSVEGVRRFTLEAIRSLDELAKKAQVAGISGETLQELRFAFSDLAGTVNSEVDESLRRFQRRLGLALEGGGPAKATFNELGIALKTVSGEARNTEEVLEETLRRLAAIESDAVRAAKASAVFGDDAGPKLAAALSHGIDKMNEAREATKGLIGESRIREAEALNTHFTNLAATISGKLKSAIVAVTADFVDFWDQAFGGDGIRTPAQRIQREIEKLELDIRNLQSIQERMGGSSFTIDFQLEELTQLRDSLQRELKRMELMTPFGDRPSRGGRPAAPSVMSGNATAEEWAFLDNFVAELAVRQGREAKELDEFLTNFVANLNSPGMNQGQKLSPELSLFIDQLREGERLTREMRTETEKQADAIREARTLFEAGVIDEQTLNRVIAAQDDMLQGWKDFGESAGAGLKDSLVNAMMGIETSWDDMIRRMLIHAGLEQLLSLLGGLGGPVGGIFSFLGFGKRASGGPVMQNQPVIVGERRPEIFIPNTAGRIESRVPTGGGGVSIAVDARGSTDPAEVERAVERGVRVAIQVAGAQTQSMISRMFRPSMA